MSPELLVQMFGDVDNLTMVKESTGDLNRMLALRELSGGQLPYYNGSNPLVLDALTAGATGWCTAAPNLRPQPCLDLYAAVRAGDTERARVIYDELAPLLRFIVAGGLPSTVKAGLELLGRGVGDPRRPLLPLDDAGRAELRGLLAEPAAPSCAGCRAEPVQSGSPAPGAAPAWWAVSQPCPARAARASAPCSPK